MEVHLTPKQALFIQEYLVDLNGAQAAIRAGYSADSAASIASENLTKPYLLDAIEQALTERTVALKVTQDYVLSNLVEVVERALQRRPVLNKKGEHVTDDEGNHLWVFDAKAAVAALTLLGKYRKMFVDRTELTGKDGGPIIQTVVGIDPNKTLGRDAAAKSQV